MNLEDIVFYGACDDTGESYIYAEKPKKTHGMWFSARDVKLDRSNLFPKDKPVKLKVVKCEEG
jgi:hypothetical protein